MFGKLLKRFRTTQPRAAGGGDNLHALDQITRSVAIASSRRAFLKRLPVLGAAVGAGMALGNVQDTSACQLIRKDHVGCCVQLGIPRWSRWKVYERACCQTYCPWEFVRTECTGTCFA